MDPALNSLINLGGVGVLAAVLLLLHRDAIKAFERQLNRDRDANRTQWQAYLEIQLRDHQQIIQALLAQDKMLAKLDDSQARLHERFTHRPSP